MANAQAKETPEAASPVKAHRDRDVYFPNTEDLDPNEMRVIACGTGMPTTCGAQAAACFLVELGNSGKFMFDLGTGSPSENLPCRFLMTIWTKYSSVIYTPITLIHWHGPPEYE